jgi:hypothetical protein
VNIAVPPEDPRHERREHRGRRLTRQRAAMQVLWQELVPAAASEDPRRE